MASQVAVDLYAKKKSSDVNSIKNKLQSITGDAVSYSFTQQEQLNEWLAKNLSKDYIHDQKEKNWHSVTHNELRTSFEDNFEDGAKYQQDHTLLSADQVTAFFKARSDIDGAIRSLLNDQWFFAVVQPVWYGVFICIYLELFVVFGDIFPVKSFAKFQRESDISGAQSRLTFASVEAL